VRGFHLVSKREKTFECGGPSGLLFFTVWCLEMKPEAGVFEITSATKKTSLKYHLNKFYELKYYFCQECQ